MFLNSRLFLNAFGCFTLVLACIPAAAATASASFGVSVTVQATCTVSVLPSHISAYSGAIQDAASSVSINCSNSVPYNVGLNAGLAPGATVATRQMIGPGSAQLGYVLESNSPGGLNGGETVGADTVSGTRNGLQQSPANYGQNSAGQQVRPGTYSDRITVTVTY